MSRRRSFPNLNVLTWLGSDIGKNSRARAGSSGSETSLSSQPYLPSPLEPQDPLIDQLIDNCIRDLENLEKYLKKNNHLESKIDEVNSFRKKVKEYKKKLGNVQTYEFISTQMKAFIDRLDTLRHVMYDVSPFISSDTLTETTAKKVIQFENVSEIAHLNRLISTLSMYVPQSGAHEQSNMLMQSLITLEIDIAIEYKTYLLGVFMVDSDMQGFLTSDATKRVKNQNVELDRKVQNKITEASLLWKEITSTSTSPSTSTSIAIPVDDGPTMHPTLDLTCALDA